MIKDALSAAMQRRPNNYELVDTDKTTGLHTIGSDINAYNSYGATPTQVALQAGAEDELHEILAHPECDPLRLSNGGHNTFIFAAVYLDDHDAPNPLLYGRQKATSEEGKAAEIKIDRMWQAIKDRAKQAEQGPALTKQEHC